MVASGEAVSLGVMVVCLGAGESSLVPPVLVEGVGCGDGASS